MHKYPNCRYCDSDRLSSQIESKCNDFENDGYILVSITPIIRGYEVAIQPRGFSVTDGVILLFHKKQVNEVNIEAKTGLLKAPENAGEHKTVFSERQSDGALE